MKHSTHSTHSTHQSPYRTLALMSVLSFASMYVLMYAMVNRLDNVFFSLNQIYMAGLMTAPMVVIELLLMRSMYPRKAINTTLMVVGILALVAFWILIRQQVAITNEQFLRSMIPHHAGAILMCEQAPLTDERVVQLCGSIVKGQQREIEEMKTLLRSTAR